MLTSRNAFGRQTLPQLESSVSSHLTPLALYIDPRGQRFGAGLSAVLFVIAIVSQQFWLAALLGLNLLIAATFGSRLFLPGRPWPLIKKTLRLRPTEPEHEYPPRFAQALGGIFVAAGTVAFVASLTVVGWVFVAGVAGLQVLLAPTGYCLRWQHLLLRRWGASEF